MRRMTFTIKTVIAFGVLALSCSMAQAVDRTWVSGVHGDDINPCSRTGPCKTFAAAYQKTDIGGQINVVDAGAYGGVTIDHSITIDGSESLSGVTVPNDLVGIKIDAGPSDVIVLRGLNIQGGGKTGIKFIGSGKLYVEDCRIFGFLETAIDFEPSGKSDLFVKDSVIRDNQGPGIFIRPLAGGSARATIDHCKLDGNLSGLNAIDDAKVVIRDSVASGNTFSGIVAATLAAAPEVTVQSCLITNNVSYGLRAIGSKAKVRFGGSTVTANDEGLFADAGSSIDSFGDNKVDGNFVNNGVPNNTIPQL